LGWWLIHAIGRRECPPAEQPENRGLPVVT
jgi:hypothetical protein